MNRLFVIYRRYARGRACLLALQLLRHGANLAVPFVFGSLVSILSADTVGAGRYLPYAGALILLKGMEVLGEYVYKRRESKECARMAMRLKDTLFQRFQALDYETRQSKGSGEWAQRIGVDSQIVASGSCPIFSELHGAVIVFVVSVGIMMHNQPLFLVLMGIMAFLFWGVYRFNLSDLREANKQVRQQSYKEHNTLLDIICLTPIIRLFKVGSFLESRYCNYAAASRNSQIYAAYMSNRYVAHIKILGWVASALTLLLALFLYSRGALGVAEVVSFDLLMMLITGQMSQLIFCIPMLTRSSETLAEMEKTFGDLLQPVRMRTPRVMQNNLSNALLKFNQVAFHYQGCEKNVIDGVDWELDRNVYTSILGKNGEGKSTLIKLLLGDLQPTQGNIERNVICPGYVPQQTAVFQASLRDNLTLCNPDIPIRKVRDIIRITRLQSLVERIGDIDAEICREQLSGGEIQRIGIARALMIEPDVLVVDEITNNLDIANKAVIFQVLQEMKRYCSIVSISHDIEALSDSDQCLLLCAGKLYRIDGDTPQEKREKAFNMIVREYEYA